MKLHYFLSCTLATGSLVIFRELRTPRFSEIRGARTIRVTEFTYDASVVSVPVVGDLVGFAGEDSDKIAGIITYVDAPKAALLVYVPVAPGVGQDMDVQGGKILWLIRPKAKVGARKT
jgi:hypothetical protein